MWLGFYKSDWVGGELVVKDKSTNSNNAKLFTGKALSFDGVNDKVVIGDVGSVKSLAFTFKPTTTITSSSAAKRILGFSTSFLGVSTGSASGDLTGETLTVLTGSNGRTGVTMNFNAGQFYRVVLVWNSSISQFDVYIDAVKQTTINAGTSVLANFSNFILGTTVNDDRFFNGLMSNVQMYNEAWIQSDVTFDYNNPNHLVTDNPNTTLTLSNLSAYYALSEGSGSIAYDSSGGGNNGTITGATYDDQQPTIPQLGLMDWSKGSNLVLNSDVGNYGNPPASEILTTDPFGGNTAIRPVPDADSDRYQETLLTANVSTGDTYTYSWFSEQITTPEVSHIGDLDIKSLVNCTIVSSSQEQIATNVGGFNRFRVSFTIDNGSIDAIFRAYFGGIIGVGNSSVAYWGHQLNKGSFADSFIGTNGLVASNATLVQNPNDKGKDVLGNSLRLRERGFNLDGSGYGSVVMSSELTTITNGTLQFWLKTSDTKFSILNGQTSSEFIGSTDNGVWTYGNAGTITSYKDGSTADTSPSYDNAWHLYTFTGINLSSWTSLYLSNLVGFDVDGIIDEAFIYSSVLTNKEMDNNYKVGLNAHKVGSAFSTEFSSEFGF